MTKHLWIALGLALCTPLCQADATVKATGSAFCFDPATSTSIPLEGARVELMDSDCDGSQVCDDQMGVSRVRQDGSFEVTGSGGDLFGGDPDVYVRFALNDDAGVRMTDEIGITRSLTTPEHNHDNTPNGSVINFGAIQFTGGSGSRCAVWLAVRNAYVAYLNEIGRPPPAGHIDIQYWSAVYSGTPWTNTDTIHWPIGYPQYAAKHEFGHSIRHQADAANYSPHFMDDVVKYRYARSHDRCTQLSSQQPGELLYSVIGYNFNEGWANYWAGTTGGCPGTSYVVMEYDEGIVALELAALQKGLGWSRSQMVDLLVAHPQQIHSMDDFESFIPGGLASAKSALNQASGLVHPADFADQLPKAITPGDRVTAIRREQSLLEAELARRKAAEVSRRTAMLSQRPIATPCRPPDCEALFQRVVVGPLSRAEAKVLQIRIDALKRAQAPAWAQTAERQFATGRIEPWLSNYRGGLQESIRSALRQGVGEAQSALIASRGKFGEQFQPYSAILTRAKARLSVVNAPAGRGGTADVFLPISSSAAERPLAR